MSGMRFYQTMAGGYGEVGFSVMDFEALEWDLSSPLR